MAKGEALLAYSFPSPHPFNSARPVRFWKELERQRLGETTVEPERADDSTVELFHEKSHLEFVRRASARGSGYLDGGDTPAFKGVLQAAEVCVGSTVSCVEKVLAGELDHGMNPVGGLHHARRERSAGFCVFNDIGVAIELLRGEGLRRVLYVDIDVHHGDGVFYPYESDAALFIFDVHEDGRFLYPGTGRAEETGKGKAAGTKVNVPLLPGEGDERIADLLPSLEKHATKARPEFIIFQCGADSLANDPLGGLSFSSSFHSRVAGLLHDLAHRQCDGRMVALGGGGYDPENCAAAWTSVTREFVARS